MKRPSVLLSIAAQVVAILTLLRVQVDMTIVTGIIAAISSILVLLGIMSDPDTKKLGYGDDIMFCENCQKDSVHKLINGVLVCKECGNPQKTR
ncbi:MAG: hypothetical protein RR885_00055 [Oscillospiraceae bacterium]